MVKRVVLATCLATLFSTIQALPQSFQGSFDFHWTTDPQNRHRIMVLLSDVSFTDKAGKVWSVPKGTKIDGASIPPALWSFAGSPFVGNYRRASVIHDRYCDIKTESASDVNKMFRDAMEADGVEYIERQSKYLAVSAYALATGAYGKQDDWLNQLSSHENLVGMVKSQELIKQLSEYKTQTDKVGTINSRTDTITAIGRVQYPLTFAALATFRRIPSEQNYTALETAVRAERPTDAAAEQIALLANATVPEGSISLPAK